MYDRRVWYIRATYNGFQFPLFLECTENHIQEYMDMELPNFYFRYSGASDTEIENAKKMHLPIYMYK